MLRRDRTLGPAASARVVALLGTHELSVHGWTPPLPDPTPAGPSPPDPMMSVPTEIPDVPPPDVPHRVGPDESAGSGASTVGALLRSGRIDPGRHGALALAVVALVAAVVAGAVLLRGRPSEQPLAGPAVAGSALTSAGPQLVVDVAGKVRRPGLVRLPAGARVDDALRAAGGVLPGVSTGALNLARKLADGEQVLVGLDGSAAPAGSGAPAGLLDLNTASAKDLDALPGIGPVLADKIVSWRTEHGRFASVDQLREVGGIGESKYQALKAKVRV